MPLKVYNTLSRKKEIFKPIEKSKVNLFVCGPTVYALSHAGHAKTYVQFDFIVKYLRFKKYKVFYLQNITDIDDKIINRAKQNGENWKNISEKYEKEYLKDMSALRVNSVNKYSRATEHISEIVSQVKRLIDKKIAYKISDGYYFDLTKFKDYGKLSKRKIFEAQEIDAVSRIDENPEKKNTGDFCLWKFAKSNEPFWKSEIGDGRPGWHIEDTAITEKEFGSQYDIHGGGFDLIFPHHEAEIAQMESISGKKPFVRFWMHIGFLKNDGKKMSKSLDNLLTIKELLKKYGKGAIRYFFISSHYRKSIEFSDKTLENSKNSYERLKNICSEIKNDGKLNSKFLKEFEKRMDDDFNTSNALQILWKIARDEKAFGKYQTIKKIDSVFGLDLFEKEKTNFPKEILRLAEERKKLRKDGEWKKADEIRKKINKQGYIIEDIVEGYNLKKRQNGSSI